jgi:hypothetical protein
MGTVAAQLLGKQGYGAGMTFGDAATIERLKRQRAEVERAAEAMRERRRRGAVQAWGNKLRAPLQFGDAEQIGLLRRWQEALERAERDAAEVEIGEMREWVLRYSVSAYRTARVVAVSQDRAEELLEEEIDDLEAIESSRPEGPADGPERVLDDGME